MIIRPVEAELFQADRRTDITQLTVGFSKNIQILSFMIIRPVGAELFQADRRTDITQLTAAFRNFANAPKNKAGTVDLTKRTLITCNSSCHAGCNIREHDAF